MAPQRNSREFAEGLDALRLAIDAVDDRILELLRERGALSLKIGEIKRARGLPVHCPEREERVLERLCAAGGVLPPELLRAIYRAIFAASRALQDGPEG